MLKCLRQQGVDSVMLQSLPVTEKLHFIYQGKVETFPALLYKLYFICVLGEIKCSFAKPYVNLFYGAYIKMYFIR